jgi:hypothetical protein
MMRFCLIRGLREVERTETAPCGSPPERGLSSNADQTHRLSAPTRLAVTPTGIRGFTRVFASRVNLNVRQTDVHPAAHLVALEQRL